MQEEMARREEAELRKSHQKSRSLEGWGLLQALWYLAFYKPVITEVHLRRKNIEFIFIRFSAWQYAGCDKLWAGLVTTLCGSIRHHFGALPLSIYHVMGSRPRFASGFSQQEWILKKNTCLKLWGLLFVLSVGISVLLVALLVPSVKDNHALKVIGSTVASLSGSGLVLGAVSIVKNLLISEKKKIERLTNSEKFTSQLGFMSKVRNEIEVLIDFLAFMEIFERRRLRVVLEITSLDICYPEKVAGVLNAMNTLLSDANSPFIFILVVDPSVIVPCLEQTSCMKGLADNGYLYLNRTVTLPFSIPEMGLRSKLQCLEDAVQTREDLMYRIITRNVERNLRRSRAKGRGEPAAAAAAAPRERSRHELDAEAVRYIHDAFRCLHDDSDRLYRYVPSSSVQVRRIVNTIPVTLRLMLHHGGPRRDLSPRAAAAWVVLANQWPCRLSWALQCLEDAGQRSRSPATLGSRSLWSIFQEHLEELCGVREALRNVLCLDGDPELFEAFLARDFPFSAAEAGHLLKFTVNLDHSIRCKMGLLRGLQRLARANAATVSRSVQCPPPPE
ncbi:NTPase KAP family P-loop domain-containing protein 1 [Apteryx rowi]|uniref:NTPase KAP family P-loop domain-containing protein 1 n=1 Tax=Apteryx rowi TaxID=308060 RepID=UPI000E1CA680|nr:NTPase KAP family P-loop domain-containing protein 1 [Apteryx rowi]